VDEVLAQGKAGDWKLLYDELDTARKHFSEACRKLPGCDNYKVWLARVLDLRVSHIESQSRWGQAHRAGETKCVKNRAGDFVYKGLTPEMWLRMIGQFTAAVRSLRDVQGELRKLGAEEEKQKALTDYLEITKKDLERMLERMSLVEPPSEIVLPVSGCPDGLKMKLVQSPPPPRPPATSNFVIGTSPKEMAVDIKDKLSKADAEAEKQRQVIIREDYYLAVHETSWAMYEAVTGKPRPRDSRSSCPAEVTWDQAQEFCDQLRRSVRRSLGDKVFDASWLMDVPRDSTDRRLSLPTEVQWEYAARNGEHGWVRPTRAAWCGKAQAQQPIPVQAEGLYQVYGFHHLFGNVREWCADRYDPTSGHYNLRGGRYRDAFEDMRPARRFHAPPNDPREKHGLRIVLVLPYAHTVR
jgi:hypothetical protein